MRYAAALALATLVVAWGCTFRSGFDLESFEAQVPLRAAGSVAVANVRTTSVDLTWASASNGLVPQSEMSYQVYFSTRLPLGTVGEARAGTPFGAALVGVTGVTVTGLIPATKYELNVIVSDGKGNEAAYEAASATTLDATPATGAVLVSNRSRNRVELSWPKATDDRTPQSELVYQAYYSTRAPFDTVSEVQAGTAVGSPAKDIAAVAVTGLAGATAYYFNVVVTDTDGGSSTYVAALAETAANPAVAITAPPANSYANAANASSFALSGTCSEEGRTVAVSGAGTATGICSAGTWSATVDVRDSAEGVFTLQVNLADSAGNAATQARRDFLKDTAAPTVAIAAPPANSYANAASASSFVLSGTCSEEGRTVAVSGAGTATGTCSAGTWSAAVDVTGAADGPITLQADLADSAGNAAAQARRDFLKDTAAPTVAIAAPPANSYANAANASAFAVSGSCSEEGRTVAVSGAGTATGICSAGTWSATVDVRGAADGPITLKADLADSAGNAAAQARRDFLKNTAAPTVAITAPPANSYANAANASAFAVSGTCSQEGRTVAVSGAGTATGTCSSGVWSATVNVSGAQEGLFTLTADVTDATGQHAKASANFIKDTVAPAAPAGAASITTTSDRPTFAWAPGGGDGAGTFRLKLDDPNLGSGATEVLTTSFTPSYSLLEGAHTAYIQERDAAGNWSATGTTSVTIVLIPNGRHPSCKYVRPISVVENSSNSLLDYQVLVVLDPATFDYSHVLASNGGDIRFEVDGTDCSYWIESWNTGGASRIWVKLPSLTSGETKTMYMYYGDASAVSVSNGDSTFILFDDFNDNSLDSAKWVDASAPPAAVKELSQKLYCKMAKPQALRGWVRSARQISETNIALHFTSLFESTEASLVAALYFDGSHVGAFDYPFNGLVFEWSTPSNAFFVDSFIDASSVVLAKSPERPADLNRHRFEVRCYDQIFEVSENDVSVMSGSSSWSFAASYVGFASRETYGTNNASNTYFDDVFVRKYVSPEPSIAIRAEALNP